MIAIHHRPLRHQLIILVGFLCLVLVCILAAGAAYIAQSRVRQIVMSREAQGAALMASMLDRDMFERYREAHNFAVMQPLKNIWAGDAPAIRQVLEQLQTSYPDYAWIGFATPDGVVKAATRGMLEEQSVQARPWFQKGLNGPALGDVHEAKLLERFGVERNRQI